MARSAQELETQPHGVTETEPPLFRVHCRSDRLQRMSPERRATYERIVKLREEIGPIDFDVAEVVRQLRQHA